MSEFRLAIVECVVATRCLELQKLVTNEEFEQEWVHYCIVRNPAQAFEVIAQKEPGGIEQSHLDPTVLGSIEQPLPNARIAKHLRGWKD